MSSFNNTVDFIIAYEQGDLDDVQIIAGFQDLINEGLCWQLQGSYGRTAKALIDNGLCTLPKKEIKHE